MQDGGPRETGQPCSEIIQTEPQVKENTQQIFGENRAQLISTSTSQQLSAQWAEALGRRGCCHDLGLHLAVTECTLNPVEQSPSD